MNETLSLNTKAILLLTAPLIVGRRKDKEPANLLKPGEYTRLACFLQETSRQPADLLGLEADQILRDSHHILGEDRLRRLLDRGFLLSQTAERWGARGIWVLSRADDDNPKKLKMRLKQDSPSLLYGCGDWEILNSGGLAVVGSRNVNGSLLEYTQQVGRLTAKAGRTVVSGGARGIDQAAMSGASRTPTHPTQSNLPFDAQQEPVKPGLMTGVTPDLQLAEEPVLSPAEELYQTIPNDTVIDYPYPCKTQKYRGSCDKTECHQAPS